MSLVSRYGPRAFEDPEVAELINSHFVPVKVDREERPDIDAVYMLACRIATGSGGWPLTILMTPDKHKSVALTGTMLDQFWDTEQGGFYMTANNSEKLLFRPKESFDGAIPSGNSVALNVMTDLLACGENENFKRSTKELIRAFSGLIQNYPTGFAHFLCGLDKAYEFL